MVVDLLESLKVIGAQRATLQKDVFEALMTGNFGRVQCVMAWCKHCNYLGDDRGVRCDLLGRD
eukprot:1401375-Pyramimonas_sp.AAC.1